MKSDSNHRQPVRLVLGALLLLASQNYAMAQDGKQGPTILPGSSDINAKKLDAFTSRSDWGSMRLSRGKLGDQKTLNIVNTVTGAPNLMVDHMILDAKTMALMHRYSPFFAVGQDYLAATIVDNALSGSLNPIGGGKPQVIDTTLSNPVFEESALGLVLATLPLETGMKFSVPRLAISGSTREFSAGVIDLEVTGRETITAGDDNEYECWVVNAIWQGVDYTETHWIADRAPYSIQKHAVFPNGRKRTSTFVEVRLE